MEPITAAAIPVFTPVLPPRRELPLAAPLWFLGVDPAAGDEAADYERGKKPTACVLLREDADGLRLDHVTRLHANAAIVALAESVAASGAVVVAIDGPCMDVPPGQTGRPCERAVQRMGLSLYLSGGNQFAGVRDWMRRSFRLFAAFADAGYVLHGALPTDSPDAMPPRTVAEVYPAVSFALVAGHAPDAPRKLPKKGVRAGDAYRAALLAALGLDLSGVVHSGPRHDLHDAAISALTGYLATRARARWLGDKEDGGGMLVPLPVLRTVAD